MTGSLVVWLALGVPAAGAPILEVYTDLAAWQTALSGNPLYLESFDGPGLNPDLTILSGCIENPGSLLCGMHDGVWFDRVDANQSPGYTEISLPFGVLGMGAIWDLKYPNFSGTSLQVTITLESSGTFVVPVEIARTTSGTFWGFTSTEPFVKVQLTEGSYQEGFFETFNLNDLRYAQNPNPSNPGDPGDPDGDGPDNPGGADDPEGPGGDPDDPDGLNDPDPRAPESATPEPATMMLIGSGLLGFGLFARRAIKR